MWARKAFGLVIQASRSSSTLAGRSYEAARALDALEAVRFGLAGINHSQKQLATATGAQRLDIADQLERQIKTLRTSLGYRLSAGGKAQLVEAQKLIDEVRSRSRSKIDDVVDDITSKTAAFS